MKLLEDKKKLKFYVQLAVAFFILNCLGSLLDNPATFPKTVVNHFWLILFLLPLNFILFEYTLPFFKLRWKRVLTGLLLIVLHILFYSFGLNSWRNLGIQLHLYVEINTFKSVYDSVGNFMGYSVSSVFFFGIVRHVYKYITLQNAAKQLLIEKQQAELNYLKAQTNPHFLFNTLNNIYSLARDKSDQAPESILRLSKILRYMLYETGSAFIAIEQELKTIDDYVALETLRYDDSLRINFNYDIEDMKQALPPLLLMPLVENAFKHGVSETRNQPFIDIHLAVKNRVLSFELKNSSEKIPEDAGVKENIGLSNLRRQLELLYSDFSLTVHQGASVFTTVLKINLGSHV